VVHAAADLGTEGIEGAEADADFELSRQIGPRFTRISLAVARREKILSEFSFHPLAALFATFLQEYRRW
jgi:hypothetical protein